MEHKHITLLNGHITWTGKEKPSEAVMEAFDAMYELIKRHDNEIRNLQRQKQDIPAIYGPPNIGSINSSDIIKPQNG